MQRILTSSRRSFLHNGSLFLAGAGLSWPLAHELLAEDLRPILRIGMVTDLHYADKAAAGTRYYRETIAKLAKAVAQSRQMLAEFRYPGFRRVIQVWDAEGQLIATLRSNLTASSATGLAFSPNGQRLFAFGQSYDLYVFDTSQLEPRLPEAANRKHGYSGSLGALMSG